MSTEPEFSDLDPPAALAKPETAPPSRARRPPSVEADENWQSMCRMRDFLEAVALGKPFGSADSMPTRVSATDRIAAARAAGAIAAKGVDLYGLPLEGADDKAKRAAVQAARKAAARTAHAGMYGGGGPQIPKSWATAPGDPAPERGLNWDTEPLGTVPDRVIALKYGIGSDQVAKAREQRGIAPHEKNQGEGVPC